MAQEMLKHFQDETVNRGTYLVNLQISEHDEPLKSDKCCMELSKLTKRIITCSVGITFVSKYLFLIWL